MLSPSKKTGYWVDGVLRVLFGSAGCQGAVNEGQGIQRCL